MEFRDPMKSDKKILMYGLVMTAVVVIGSVLGAGIAVMTTPRVLQDIHRPTVIKPFLVQVSTERSVYRPGEDIHINISFINDLIENITLSDSLYTVSISGPHVHVFSFDGGGIFVRAEVIQPGVSCWIGQSIWNQTDANHQQVPPGEYIIEVNFVHASYHGETSVLIEN